MAEFLSAEYDDVDIDFEAEKPRYVRPPEKRLDSPISLELISRIKTSILNATQHDIESSVNSTTKTDLVASIILTADKIRNDRLLSYGGLNRTLRHIAGCLSSSSIQYSTIKTLTAREYVPILRSNISPYDYKSQEDAAHAASTYEHIISAYITQISDILPPEEIKKVRHALSVRPLDYLAEKYANLEFLWSKIVDRYRVNGSASSTIWKTFGTGIHAVYGRGYCLIVHPDLPGSFYIATYEQLQMLQDCLLARHNVFAALSVGLPQGSERLRDHIVALMDWQSECLLTHGNSGYEIVKAPEAIFKVWINTLCSGDILSFSSYHRTLQKMIDKDRKLGGSGRLIHQLKIIVERVTDLRDAAELFGLSKMSGHPSVYAAKSAGSVRKEACKKGSVVPLMVHKMTRATKHIILSNYIRVHTSWPPLRSLPYQGTQLRRHYNNQVTELPMNSYDMSDLDVVEFDQFLNFDYSEDYLKFLDDKAICPGADKTNEFWFGQKTETRRLLLKVAEMTELDLVAVVNRLRVGDFTENELIVELTQKERELKEAARCYCKLPINVRCFFTLTEYNLGEYLMKDYFPQQTMTMSASATKSRLYRLAQKALSKTDTALLEVDFSRWNLRWRDETVRPVATILEHIFGLEGVFTQAHSFFSRSTIVMTDKNALPDGVTPGSHASSWPESELVWRNHYGGFEGIQQKLWTICTIAMMYVVFSGSGASFLMAGQGDNQIFAIDFDPAHGTCQDQLIKLLATMEIRCNMLNHEVKPDECIDSAAVITYSKELYVNGYHLQYCLKFASRSMSVSDNDLPSLASELSTVSASAVALADTLSLPLKAYYWQCYRVLRLIRERINSPVHEQERYNLKQVFRSTQDRRDFALLLPGSLGGLPLQSFGRYFMKGEVDDLSWDVSAVLKLKETVPPLDYDLAALVDKQYSTRKPDLTHLVADPHSIPIDRPLDQKRMVKDAVASRFASIVNNRAIYDIVSLDTKTAGAELLKILSESTPLHPEIMADIAKCSLYGLRDEILGRFTMTRTISDLLKDRSFVTEIMEGNRDLLRYIETRHRRAVVRRNRCAFKPGDSFAVCSTLRSFWGPSVDNTSIGTYCPLDMKLTTDIVSTDCVSAHSLSPPSTFLTTTGPYPPNFGTRTRQKRSEHGYKIITSSDTVRDLKLLYTTLSEIGATPNFVKLCDAIMLSRSPYTSTTLAGVMPSVYGGTAAHRHDKMQSQPFSTLGSNTVPTHLTFCTDISKTLSGGQQDYPLVFQELFLFLTGLAQLSSACKQSSPTFCVGVLIPSMREITSSVVNIPEPPIIQWPKVVGNKLAYVSALQFQMVNDIPPPSTIARENPKRTSLLFSSILHRFSSTKPSLSGMSISGPVEAYDLKEMTGFSAFELLKIASECAAVETVYQTVMSTGPSPSRFDSTLYSICWGYSLIFGRILLHPIFSSDPFVKTASLNCGPAYFGPAEIRGPITGQLIIMAKMTIQSGFLQSGDRKLFFFEDSGSKMANLALKTAVFWICTSKNRSTRLKITTHEKAVLMSSYLTGVRSNDPVLSLRLIIRAMDHLYQTAPRRSRETTYYPTNWPPFRFTHKVEAEAVRQLRIDEVKVTNIPAYRPIGMTTTPATGKVTWCSIDVEGSLPICTVDDTINYHDTGKSYLCRPAGRFASVYSDWYAYLMANPHIRREKSIVSVGVGLGAVGSVFLDLTASRVVGHEIPVYFPLISQRDLSYKPLEIRTRDDTRFSWHPDCFRRPFTPGEKYDHFAEDNALLVFDIDCFDIEVLTSIAKSTIRFCARVRTCERNIKSFLSVCRCAVTCASVSSTSHARIWFLYGESNGIPMSASNYERVEIKSIKPWIPKFHSCPDQAAQRFDDLISRYGYQEPCFSFSRSAEITAEIRQLKVPPEAENQRDKTLDRLSGYAFLKQCIDNNQLDDLFTLENREARRTAIIHLASTQPSLARTLI